MYDNLNKLKKLWSIKYQNNYTVIALTLKKTLGANQNLNVFVEMGHFITFFWLSLNQTIKYNLLKIYLLNKMTPVDTVTRISSHCDFEKQKVLIITT